MTDLKQTLATLEAAARRKLYRRIDFFEPYPKQELFFAAGALKRERLLMAGNQLGKTYAGAAETTYHMTGEYPTGWLGRYFDRPTRGWAAGETSLLVRDVQQKLLFGEPGVESALGTGMVPKECILDYSLARGVTDAFDTVQVKHIPTGKVSIVKFKSYEQGRTKFQGETLDWIWFDEEPPLDIYTEGLTRTNKTMGPVFMTFTPLKGMSEVVLRFLNEKSDTREVITMTIEDALHIPPEKRAEIIASYPAHERDARTKGIPMLGSGRIFKYSDEAVMEPSLPLSNVPLHWAKLWAIDFGIDHPFAAVLLAWDREVDTVHILHTLRISDALPLNHATSMLSVAAAVPVAYPHDGDVRDRGSGEQLATIYKKHGLLMLPEKATFSDGSISTEAGIMKLDERMKNGKLKVAAHLGDWFEEFRLYHRKDGLIVKLKDDLMSATRIGEMALRHARPVPLGPKKLKRRAGDRMCTGVDFPLH